MIAKLAGKTLLAVAFAVLATASAWAQVHANNDSYGGAQEDTLFTIAPAGVLSNDSLVTGAAAVVDATTPNGTLTLNTNGGFTYMPDPNYNGSDTFTYHINFFADGSVHSSNIATVTIAINTVNDAPVAVDDSFSATAGVPLVVPSLGVLVNDYDIDSFGVNAVLNSGPAHGTLTLNPNGGFTYTASSSYSGVDTFTYVDDDLSVGPTHLSAPATVTLTVAAPPGNTAPVAVNDSYTTPYGTALNVTSSAGVLVNDIDTESNPLTAVLAAAPTSGALTLAANGGFGFTPAAGFSGPVTFTYNANDGTVNSAAPATVTITVGPAPSGAPNPATGQIQDFLGVRAGILLPDAADVQPHIDRLNGTPQTPNVGGSVMGFLPMAFSGGAATASASLNAIQAAAGEQPSKLDIWMKGTFGHFDANTVNGLYGLGAVGADYLVSSDLLLGGYVQVDQFGQNQKGGPGTLNGTGWTAGPYATARLGENLYLDLKAAAGTSSNQISPLGTYTDNFTTARWLFNAQLVGKMTAGDWSFYPGGRVSYYQENASAYTDSLGASVPAVTEALAQVALSPAVSYRLTTDGGVVIDTSLKLEGIADYAGTGGALAFTTLHARVAPEIAITLAGGAQIRLSGYYDSAATIGLQSVGAALRFSAPLPVH